MVKSKKAISSNDVNIDHFMALHSITIDPLYVRYQRLEMILPRQLRWLALVFAPIGISLTVFISGLIMVVAGMAVTVGIGQITSNGITAMSVAWLLVLAFLAESIGYVIKERQELLLTVVVRQLVYRRFRSVFDRSLPTLEARGHVLTYPGQISQFAYVVDSAVSTFQVIAFLGVTLWLYGISGGIAVLIIVGLLLISIRLISLVGRLWEQYVAYEGERRHWIQRVANALPRGRVIPSWDFALNAIIDIRNKEEQLLFKRVKLQVVNGFIDRSALTVTLAVVAILSSWLWPDTRLGIGIILAARYLYAAVQNNLINYRVIRLAIPMMRELDKLESSSVTQGRPRQAIDSSAQRVEVVMAASERAEVIRSSLVDSESVYVPRNPELTQSVLLAWRDEAKPEELFRFENLSSSMGLSEDVIQRFWQDAQTLSSGERHRAAVALVLAEEPTRLVLDDTFAALDPATRDTVAQIIFKNVPLCTIITSSEEYVPTTLGCELNSKQDAQSSRFGCQKEQEDFANLDAQSDLPDPLPKRASIWRAVELLFGLHVVWIILGAVLLAGSEVAFALLIARSDVLSSQTAYTAGACALAAVLGSVMFFGSIYRVPIARLSDLHRRVICRIDRFARPRNSGAVVGRLGEDFADLQMSIPSALGSVFIVIIQTILLTAGAIVGVPLFIGVVVALIPLAFFAMRQGTKRIIPASTATANKRGEFLGAVTIHAGLHTAPVSNGLRRAAEAAYDKCESNYLQSSIRQVNAYAYRSILIQSIIVVLNVSAVILVATFGGANLLIAPAAVIFFAATLSAGVRSTVETLQEADVLGLTTERVRLLEDFEVNHSYPSVRVYDLDRLKTALDSNNTLVALIGATGAGKSVILDALYRCFPDGYVKTIPDTDPFASEETDMSGLVLARSESRNGNAQLLLLDETLKALTRQQERDELQSLAETLESNGKQAVIVLHSRSNLDCFNSVVDLDE